MAQLLHLVFLSATDVVIFYKEVQFPVLILIAWHFHNIWTVCGGGVGGIFMFLCVHACHVYVCVFVICVCVCVCERERESAYMYICILAHHMLLFYVSVPISAVFCLFCF